MNSLIPMMTSKPILILRSLLFYIACNLTTWWFSLTFLIVIWLPFRPRYRYLSFWSSSVILLARVFCGIRYRVHGLAKLDTQQPAVIMSKHQSQWETFFLMRNFQPISIICKKELLEIPGFGWGLGLLKPIPIDRSNPRNALKDIQKHGAERLTVDQIPVMIFPEGTRMVVGEKGKYARSGAALAIATKVPVIAVSHNAGYCWPTETWIKRPGLVDIYFSDAISAEGKTALELTQEVEDWIEARVDVPKH